MRFQGDPAHPDFHIADTPNIHDLPIPRTVIGPSHVSLIDHYCTVDLSIVNGLTLFFENGFRLVSIFGHTRQRPYAGPPTELMTDCQLDSIKWTYIPLPKGEKILSLSKGYNRYLSLIPMLQVVHNQQSNAYLPMSPNLYVSV